MGKVIDYKEMLYKLEEIPYDNMTPKQRNIYGKLLEWEENEGCQYESILLSDEEYTKRFKELMNNLALPIKEDK